MKLKKGDYYELAKILATLAAFTIVATGMFYQAEMSLVTLKFQAEKENRTHEYIKSLESQQEKNSFVGDVSLKIAGFLACFSLFFWMYGAKNKKWGFWTCIFILISVLFLLYKILELDCHIFQEISHMCILVK